jgi:hypothetical protein
VSTIQRRRFEKPRKVKRIKKIKRLDGLNSGPSGKFQKKFCGTGNSDVFPEVNPWAPLALHQMVGWTPALEIICNLGYLYSNKIIQI